MHLENVVSDSPDDPQKVISVWRLGDQVIGGGRFYNIFRAAPKSLPADSKYDYVIKVINPDLCETLVPHAIARLSREAIATEQICQPNVIRLLDAELDRAPFFLVQPWIYGRSLDCLLSRAPHLSLSRLLWVLRQTAEGVRAGHENGRAYLGMDPSHILIGRTGRVTLIGWSHSHAIDEVAEMPQDQLQLARYAAPECFEEGYRATPASDVYSLGAMIHHALAKEFAFDGQTTQEIFYQHQNYIPEDLVVLQSECPGRLGSLVKQMLSKDPIRRPSFRSVLNELISIEIEFLSNSTLIKL